MAPCRKRLSAGWQPVSLVVDLFEPRDRHTPEENETDGRASERPWSGVNKRAAPFPNDFRHRRFEELHQSREATLRQVSSAALPKLSEHVGRSGCDVLW